MSAAIFFPFLSIRHSCATEMWRTFIIICIFVYVYMHVCMYAFESAHKQEYDDLNYKGCVFFFYESVIALFFDEG